MFEYRTQGNDNSPQELLRYVYSNHLQSSMLELSENGEIISYEEYHPFGTTSYQATNAQINAVAKRYRYTGKERDEESGLYYHACPERNDSGVRGIIYRGYVDGRRQTR